MSEVEHYMVKAAAARADADALAEKLVAERAHADRLVAAAIRLIADGDALGDFTAAIEAFAPLLDEHDRMREADDE